MFKVFGSALGPDGLRTLDMPHGDEGCDRRVFRQVIRGYKEAQILELAAHAKFFGAKVTAQQFSRLFFRNVSQKEFAIDRTKLNRAESTQFFLRFAPASGAGGSGGGHTTERERPRARFDRAGSSSFQPGLATWVLERLRSWLFANFERVKIADVRSRFDSTIASNLLISTLPVPRDVERPAVFGTLWLCRPRYRILCRPWRP